ncbi:MAG: hypothetical protein HY205_03540 [Nitrospirae bacterium]|nr:hypothetical protein [Nitrospirota bacterium]
MLLLRSPGWGSLAPIPGLFSPPRKQSSSQKLSGGKTSSSSQGRTNAAELTEQAIRLTAELAAWRLATSLREAVESEETTAVQRVLGQASTQRSWLIDAEGRRALRRAVHFMALDLTLTSTQPVQPGAPAGYAEYEAYLNQTYPRLTGGAESWLAVAEREGAEGIRRRLMEFWKSGAGHEADRDALMQRYAALRLHPMLTAQAIASAARAEAEAERQARDAWRLVQTWRDRVQEQNGLARLCGTWHWTIHNHQNHQDHRTVMSFPPANAPSPAASPGQPGPQPAKIVARGDVLYLRWEFQGGYQEDSLLFAGEVHRSAFIVPCRPPRPGAPTRQGKPNRPGA